MWIIKAQPRCAPNLIVYFLQQTNYMQQNDMASVLCACKDGKHADAIFWQPRRAPQKAVLSIILAYYRQQSSQYKRDMSALCLYLLLIAVIDRLPLCNTQPLRCLFSIFVKKFFLKILACDKNCFLKIFF